MDFVYEEKLNNMIERLKKNIEDKEYQKVNEKSTKAEVELLLAQQLYLTKLEGELYNLTLKRKLKTMSKTDKVKLIMRNTFNWLYVNIWLAVYNRTEYKLIKEHNKVYKNATYLKNSKPPNL